MKLVFLHDCSIELVIGIKSHISLLLSHFLNVNLLWFFSGDLVVYVVLIASPGYVHETIISTYFFTPFSYSRVVQIFILIGFLFRAAA